MIATKYVKFFLFFFFFFRHAHDFAITSSIYVDWHMAVMLLEHKLTSLAIPSIPCITVMRETFMSMQGMHVHEQTKAKNKRSHE